MSELLRLILANALAAGLLAVAAWAVSRHVRRQSLVHGLWVLALVKLVTPPIVPLPLLPEWTLPALILPDGPAMVVIEAGPSTRPATPAPTATELLLATEGAAFPVLAEAASAAFPPLAPAPRGVPPLAARPSGPAWGLADLAPLAWTGLLAGALAVAGLTFWRVRRFRRLLRLALPAPAMLSTRAGELARRVGLRRVPPVLLLPARVPPMLWPGRRGPLLLLPADLLPELSDEERDTLLVHELAHVRRRDHWVRILELAVTAVFWWYPVTWWVRRALRRAEERCCDEWVLRVMPASASAYAEGLLKSLDFVAGEPDPLPVGASGAGPVRDLEARLKEILMMKPTPHLAAPARLALVAAAVLGLAAFPTQAQSPAPDEETVLASPAKAELPPAPPAPGIVDTAAPVAPAAPAVAPAAAPAVPEAPAAPADAPRPALAAPAAPAPRDDVPPPVLAAPAPPAPHDPVVSGPAPEPRPVVAPTPRPRPFPMPEPAPVIGPVPAVLPAGPNESPEDEAARRKIEEQQKALQVQHQRLEEQRAELHAQELVLARERMAEEAAARQERMQVEAERLRAAGETEHAARVEQHARANAERLAIQRRDVDLELSRLEEQHERQEVLRSKARELRALRAEGREDEAAELSRSLSQLAHEEMQANLVHEQKQLELQRETLEVEHRARRAEFELQKSLAGRDHEDLEVRLEHERQRMEWEHSFRGRELALHDAEHALMWKQRELGELESSGRDDEAEAVRTEAEEMRQGVEAARRGLQEDRLLQAGEHLRLQMESQLDALRQIQSEGAEDGPEVEREIERLQAALAALRQ